MSALRYVNVGPFLLLVLLALLTATVAARRPWKQGRYRDAVAAAARVLLLGAAFAVLAVTLTSGFGSSGVNLVPLVGIREQLSNVNRDLAVGNIVGNVLMFMPLGLLGRIAWRLRVLQVVGFCVAFSVVIEALQLFLGRSADVDDVLLNGLGSVR